MDYRKKYEGLLNTIQSNILRYNFPGLTLTNGSVKAFSLEPSINDMLKHGYLERGHRKRWDPKVVKMFKECWSKAVKGRNLEVRATGSLHELFGLPLVKYKQGCSYFEQTQRDSGTDICDMNVVNNSPNRFASDVSLPALDEILSHTLSLLGTHMRLDQEQFSKLVFESISHKIVFKDVKPDNDLMVIDNDIQLLPVSNISATKLTRPSQATNVTCNQSPQKPVRLDGHLNERTHGYVIASGYQGFCKILDAVTGEFWSSADMRNPKAADCGMAVVIANLATQLRAKNVLSLNEKIELPPLIEVTNNGPAITVKYEGGYEIDTIATLKCSFWPDEAKAFIVRNRPSGWPSSELIQSITESGCHVVPVAHPFSNDREHEFRYSFSIPEIKLAESLGIIDELSELSRNKCYLLLKIILKFYIKQTQDGDYVKSYFLKTIFFRMNERILKSDWKSENMFRNFCMLLVQLEDHFSRHCFENYFIETNNMISHLTSTACKNITKTFNEIRKDPLKILFNINRFVIVEQWLSPRCYNRHIVDDVLRMFGYESSENVCSLLPILYENTITSAYKPITNCYNEELDIDEWQINIVCPQQTQCYSEIADESLGDIRCKTVELFNRFVRSTLTLVFAKSARLWLESTACKEFVADIWNMVIQCISNCECVHTCDFVGFLFALVYTHYKEAFERIQSVNDIEIKSKQCELLIQCVNNLLTYMRVGITSLNPPPDYLYFINRNKETTRSFLLYQARLWSVMVDNLPVDLQTDTLVGDIQGNLKQVINQSECGDCKQEALLEYANYLYMQGLYQNCVDQLQQWSVINAIEQIGNANSRSSDQSIGMPLPEQSTSDSFQTHCSKHVVVSCEHTKACESQCLLATHSIYSKYLSMFKSFVPEGKRGHLRIGHVYGMIGSKCIFDVVPGADYIHQTTLYYHLMCECTHTMKNGGGYNRLRDDFQKYASNLEDDKEMALATALLMTREAKVKTD